MSDNNKSDKKVKNTELTVGASAQSAIVQYVTTPPLLPQLMDSSDTERAELVRLSNEENAAEFDGVQLANRVYEWMERIIKSHGIDETAWPEVMQATKIFSNEQEKELATPEFKTIRQARTIMIECKNVVSYSEKGKFEKAAGFAMRIALHVQFLMISMHEREIISGAAKKQSQTTSFNELKRLEINASVRDHFSSWIKPPSQNRIFLHIQENFNLEMRTIKRYFRTLAVQVIRGISGNK